MMNALFFVLATAIGTQPVQATTDVRSNDAVLAFDDLCVSLFIGKEAKADPARFSVAKISDGTARKIKPNLNGQTLWDVSGTQSDVHLLVHYEPAGLCVVEVAEADEKAMRVEFERLVQQVSSFLDATPQRQADKRNRVDGKDATSSAWRLKSPTGDIMLAVTTYPDPKFMIQHLMTASYVQ